ncbi:Preprotein translocase subunit YidC [Candidatus Blochmanniella floridana]|uniref:Membrane protein insertase YidC n=1 Tax=Blochmanniella floridana TaxID=203907 RepID=YIDC_BLOFL|nr:RecName: Full=Membrane protein insertase YidC; AltName: Full=Foldase YidC; AltName: Full=Membrane integrase YidC; AltName: Full=Membrane protein YidC [Candidatus Blochmannia floridanus]CAD83540.1 Preprotein translocase subunit YidC [Candidatus Blochmannia floridanus]
MESQRSFFIIVFLIVSFILWKIWDDEHHINLLNIENNHSTLQPYSIQSHESNQNTPITHTNNPYSHIITIKTDVFLLKINTYSGNIEEAYLNNYQENLNSQKPLKLLHTSKENKYQAYIDIETLNEYFTNDLNQKNKKHYLYYSNTTNQCEYILKNNENKLQFDLTYQGPNNIIYTKRYLLNRNDYSIYITYIIDNQSTYPIHIKLYGNLIQSIHSDVIQSKHNDHCPLYTYQEAAYSTDTEKYQKYNLKDIKHTNLNIHSTNGWIALLQKYFIIALLPITPKDNTFYTTYLNNHDISIGFKSDFIHIPPGKKNELQSILWMGPKIQDNMKLVAPNLDLVIDYGWLWFISHPLFKLLQFIHTYTIDNWGISIILITVIIRLIMYPLTKAQYTSMAKIRMLQPKLISIQEEYKHDKYQYHQKTIELYKKEKVNPLGGCLPLLIQMPIFLALYYMLSESVELRHAKFAFWIKDLSDQDPYYILPIIMGITMFFIQKLSPTTITDPIQKKIMNIMLVIFTIFFLWFPSGLVLYYIISNIITIIQQQVIYHDLSKKGLHNKK